MGVRLSIKAKLVLAADTLQELMSAMEEFNRACNTLSELAFQQDLHRQYDIHHAGYRLIRDETNLPSQHVINAIAKVSAAYTRVEGSQPARSGSSLSQEASSTKPETARSIYSASLRLYGVVDCLKLEVRNFRV